MTLLEQHALNVARVAADRAAGIVQPNILTGADGAACTPATMPAVGDTISYTQRGGQTITGSVTSVSKTGAAIKTSTGDHFRRTPAYSARVVWVRMC